MDDAVSFCECICEGAVIVWIYAMQSTEVGGVWRVRDLPLLTSDLAQSVMSLNTRRNPSKARAWISAVPGPLESLSLGAASGHAPRLVPPPACGCGLTHLELPFQLRSKLPSDEKSISYGNPVCQYLSSKSRNELTASKVQVRASGVSRYHTQFLPSK